MSDSILIVDSIAYWSLVLSPRAPDLVFHAKLAKYMVGLRVRVSDAPLIGRMVARDAPTQYERLCNEAYISQQVGRLIAFAIALKINPWHYSFRAFFFLGASFESGRAAAARLRALGRNSLSSSRISRSAASESRQTVNARRISAVGVHATTA